MGLARFDADEWSALYVDGVLDRVGDSYLIDERIATIAGVQTIAGGEILMPNGIREIDVPKTLDAAEQAIREHEQRKAQSEQLREQAAALEAEATAL